MSTNKNYRVVIFGLAASILVGCATQGDVGSSQILGSSRGSHGQYSTYQFAAGNRDLQTVIVGNPFSLKKSEFDNQVTKLMQGNDRGINANFTVAASENMRTGYSAVMMFNPSSGTSLDQMCGDPNKLKSTIRGQQIKVILVFCGPGPISAGSATLQSASSISDQKFNQLVRDVTFRMTPNEPPDTYD